MPTDSRRVKDLFVAALDLPDEPARRAFLDEACGDNAGLRRRLDILLAAHDRPDAALDRPLGTPAADVATGIARLVDESAPDPTAVVGAVVAGRYKLLERVGEGGMGTVWMAEQREPVKRLVAVKLIKAGMDSRSVLARFEAERQALALMDHPNIAKVLDGGTTAEGRPYFVMELVKGLPLTEYCDARRLSVRDRLDLFGQVCSAVQHAHQKGVIHRDLKPTNVLVTEHDGRPVPKVIDFGLAKALTAGALTDKTLHTSFGAVVGTPLYMAPEQVGINALDVDTRTDIYALGVILYELLTGTTPLEKKRLREAAWDEMRRLIREEEPPRPSLRLSSSDALPSLAANRQSEPKRLTGLVRGELDWIVMKALEKDRNRRYETANGLAMDVQRHLAGEAVQAVPPSAAYRLRKAYRRNRGPVLAAGAILGALLAGLVATSYGFYRADVHRQRAEGAERSAVANALTATDAAEAERKAKLDADVRRREAEAAKAEAQAKAAEADAVTTFFERKVFAAGRPRGTLFGRGHDVSLRDAVRASLPGLATDFKEQPLVEARLRAAVGITFGELGDYKSAAEQIGQARALYTRHRGPDHEDTLASMNNLANCYLFLDRPADALTLYLEVLAVRRRVLPPDRPEMLKSMCGLANSYAALNRHAEALKLREELVAASRRVLPPDDPDTLSSVVNLSASYIAAGRLLDAVKLCEEALPAMKAKLAGQPTTFICMNNLALSYARLNRHAEAIPLREELLAARRLVLPPDHPDTITNMFSLANSYAALNRHAEALKLFEESLAAQRRVLPADHPDTILGMINVAKSYYYLGRYPEALPLFDEVLPKADRPGVDSRLIPIATRIRFQCRLRLGNVAGWRATAEFFEKRNPTDPAGLYNAARYRAMAAALQAKEKDADAARLAAEEADRAMAWLMKAVAAGYADAAHMKKDADLDALRDRADFQKLVAELEAKSPAKADPAPSRAKK